jgi:mRNA-degrading endonuclease RelE of RelBE toxin-antitoxin system
MFRVTYTKSFVSHFKRLPYSVQIKTDTQVSMLMIDFRDSRLHSKKLQSHVDLYSFRIGRDYRCIFMFENGDTIKLIDIQHRKDIYKGIR